MARKRKVLELVEFLSSSSSSDEEADYIQMNQMYYELYNQRQKRAKIMNYVQEVVPSYTDRQFKEHFRVDRGTYERLTASFKRSRFFPKHRRGTKVTNAKTHMLSFLWYIGNKCVLRDVADRCGISISTQHSIITRVLNFFVAIAPNIIKVPNTEEEKHELANGFKEISGFPGINGCIDGCYIEIRTPKHKLRSTYTNRHDKTSITLQGICDEHRRFLDVFTGISSKIHDSRVFHLSFIYDKMMNMGENFHLLGDAAYPLRLNLMTPYRDYGNLTEVQRNYNFKFSSTRVRIENTFGILKARFRQLMKLENQTVLRMSKIILSCCVLHNICVNENDDFVFDEVPDDEEIVLVDDNEVPGNAAVQKRDQIAEELFVNRRG